MRNRQADELVKFLRAIDFPGILNMRKNLFWKKHSKKMLTKICAHQQKHFEKRLRIPQIVCEQRNTRHNRRRGRAASPRGLPWTVTTYDSDRTGTRGWGSHKCGCAAYCRYWSVSVLINKYWKRLNPYKNLWAYPWTTLTFAFCASSAINFFSILFTVVT